MRGAASQGQNGGCGGWCSGSGRRFGEGRPSLGDEASLQRVGHHYAEFGFIRKKIAAAGGERSLAGPLGWFDSARSGWLHWVETVMPPLVHDGSS